MAVDGRHGLGGIVRRQGWQTLLSLAAENNDDSGAAAGENPLVAVAGAPLATKKEEDSLTAQQAQ